MMGRRRGRRQRPAKKSEEKSEETDLLRCIELNSIDDDIEIIVIMCADGLGLNSRDV